MPPGPSEITAAYSVDAGLLDRARRPAVGSWPPAEVRMERAATSNRLRHAAGQLSRPERTLELSGHGDASSPSGSAVAGPERDTWPPGFEARLGPTAADDPLDPTAGPRADPSGPVPMSTSDPEVPEAAPPGTAPSPATSTSRFDALTVPLEPAEDASHPRRAASVFARRAAAAAELGHPDLTEMSDRSAGPIGTAGGEPHHPGGRPAGNPPRGAAESAPPAAETLSDRAAPAENARASQAGPPDEAARLAVTGAAERASEVSARWTRQAATVQEPTGGRPLGGPWPRPGTALAPTWLDPADTADTAGPTAPTDPAGQAASALPIRDRGPGGAAGGPEVHIDQITVVTPPAAAATVDPFDSLGPLRRGRARRGGAPS